VRILFVTSEVAPLAKTGGLADVSAALPRYLARAGHDVRVFLPFYNTINPAGAEIETVFPEVDVALGEHGYRVSIVAAKRAGEPTVYLVRCPPLYHRGSLYTADADEHLRFVVLCRAAIAACQRMGFSPDVAHCNDWQSALLPLILETRFAWDRLFRPTRTLLTIHNLSYQGVFPASAVAHAGLAESAHLFHQEQLRAGRVNFLLHGILYANGVTTVSPTYAREIQGPELGVGLDPFLRARSSTVVGILNGVDYDEWSPERDPLIPARYSSDDLSGKAADKAALQEEVGLPASARAPLAGIVSRLAGQKGFALLEEALPPLLRRQGLQLVALGSGERRLEQLFQRLAAAFPRQVAFVNRFSNQLAHRIEAGADIFLMPSLYEPCGLNQMYSLRYGTVPVVHRTGGLADTVRPFRASTGEGTGFVFEHHTAVGLAWAIEAALDAYGDPAAWARLQRNGMAEDYSWDRQGKLYEQVYAALQGRGG
jgi:starch synthase